VNIVGLLETTSTTIQLKFATVSVLKWTIGLGERASCLCLWIKRRLFEPVFIDVTAVGVFSRREPIDEDSAIDAQEHHERSFLVAIIVNTNHIC
jgi:hypothetical protein